MTSFDSLVNVYLIAVFSAGRPGPGPLARCGHRRRRAQPPRPPDPPRVAARVLRSAPRPAPLSRRRPGGLAGSARAPRVRVPGPPGRPAPGRHRQQRRLRRLPAGGAARRPAPPRHRRLGRSPVRGWWSSGRSSSTSCPSPWLPARCSSPPGSPRSGGPPSRSAYELFTEPAGADAPVVHARATTTLTPYDFGAERPRRLTDDERRAAPARAGALAVRRPATAWPTPVPGPTRPGGRTCTCGSPTSTSWGTSTTCATSTTCRRRRRTSLIDCLREAAVDGHVEFVVARTEIDYRGQMNLRPEPYDVWARVDGGRPDVGVLRGRDPGRRPGDGALPLGRGVPRRGRPASSADPRAPRGLRAAPRGCPRAGDLTPRVACR